MIVCVVCGKTVLNLWSKLFFIWRKGETTRINRKKILKPYHTVLVGNTTYQVQTRYPTVLEVFKNSNSTCSTTHHFEQYEVYQPDLDNCNISVLS